jgi:microcystin-dependent protein
MSSFVNLMDIVYPVGSIYHTTNSTSPATRFGGTWSAITSQFLIGADDTYSAGSTGGEATHTLTVSEMPSHNHCLGFVAYDKGHWGTDGAEGANPGAANGDSTPFANGNRYSYQEGGGQAHNNLPPYYAVYIWKRTA